MDQFNVAGNEYMTYLNHHFNDVASGIAQLNGVHDTFRRCLDHEWPTECAWGEATGVHFLLD